MSTAITESSKWSVSTSELLGIQGDQHSSSHEIADEFTWGTLELNAPCLIEVVSEAVQEFIKNNPESALSVAAVKTLTEVIKRSSGMRRTALYVYVYVSIYLSIYLSIFFENLSFTLHPLHLSSSHCNKHIP